MPKLSSTTRNLHPDKNRILIMGNGFDLSLGLKTSYKSFKESCFWPYRRDFLFTSGSLSEYLQEYKDIDTWFDLEELFFQYASNPRMYTPIPEDTNIYNQNSFNEIRQSLIEYLKIEENKTLEKNTLATAVLKLFQNLDGNKSIYSFNYTDFPLLAKNIGLPSNTECSYVHGSIKNGDIILGVGDKHELKDQFFFMHKSAQITHPNNIISDLENADDIIIYGHSLGFNDYDYFIDFFQRATKQRASEEEKRRITIITKNQKSALDIKKNLMKLTDRQLIRLQVINDFEIVCSDDKEKAINRIKTILV